MSRCASRAILAALAALTCITLSCNGLGDIFTSLGQNVRIIIENDTAYEATPDIRTSNSSNVFEDIFAHSNQVTDFGDDGTVPANQTVTVYLDCNGDLEHITIGDVEFREHGGDEVGTEDANASLRRDTDFDCGDTIRLRLSGGVFNFSVDVDVEQAAHNND